MSDVHRFAWQGWEIATPSEWDPVRLEGDFDGGTVLLADLNGPRLGVRWRRFACDGKSARHAERALRDEVGTLAAAEAIPFTLSGDWFSCLLYTEPKPPGRDVFVGVSNASNRLLQVACHVKRRDDALKQVITHVRDASEDDEQPWSVFDLWCRVPRSLRLASHKLLAGDLSLSFASVGKPAKQLTIRQVGVAGLALQRSSIEQWLRRQQSTRAKHYRAAKAQDEIELTTTDGRTLMGVRGTMTRRRRFFFMRSLPRELLTLALHDEARDRLVIVQSNHEEMARKVAETVGVAREEQDVVRPK